MPFALSCEMSQHTIPLSEREPCRSFRRRVLAGPGLPGGSASLDLWAVLKCLCVARKLFNSGLYNGIESPERTQRTTRHSSATPPGRERDRPHWPSLGVWNSHARYDCLIGARQLRQLRQLRGPGEDPRRHTAAPPRRRPAGAESRRRRSGGPRGRPWVRPGPRPALRYRRAAAEPHAADPRGPPRAPGPAASGVGVWRRDETVGGRSSDGPSGSASRVRLRVMV